jgi:hypothetical protein
MNPVGSISVGPTDRTVEVGSFSLEEDDDTLFVDVQQMSPNQVWNYSFGLLWWESAFGRELGTEKVYGHQVGETYKLGIGRTPRSRSGRIMFAPRAYNRRWISIENPPTWTLSISAESAQSGSGSLPDVPTFGVRATLGSLVNPDNTRIPYTIINGIAYIQ